MDANQPSEARRYSSKYTPGKYVTAAQWTAELMCERKARSEKTDLPLQFWQDKEWAKFLKHQIVVANRLFKEFDEKAIGRALRRKELNNVWSLADKRVRPIVRQEHVKALREKEMLAEQAKLKVEEEASREQVQLDKTGNERPVFVDKNSTLNKLKGL